MMPVSRTGQRNRALSARRHGVRSRAALPVATTLLAAALFVSACSSDSSSSTTQVVTATTTVPSTSASGEPSTSVGSGGPVPSTTMAAGPVTMPELESISYLIQGLLTTDEIGGGWVDQGRQVIPPGSDTRGGFLCSSGQTLVDAMAGRFEPQVATMFQQPDRPLVTVHQSLLWGPAQQIADDFTTWSRAIETCAGSPYQAPDGGQMEMTVLPLTTVGTASIAYSFAPIMTTGDPWLENHTIDLYAWDGTSEVAVGMSIGITVVHDPSDVAVPAIDHAELDRIAEEAITRLQGGL